jgi:hypothetical protein
MKHDWPMNVLTFRRGGRKIQIHTTKGRISDKATAPVYAEGINMLEGLTEEEADTSHPTVLRECHSGVASGHYAGEVTTRKVWQSGLWWPMVLRDAHLFAKECDLCQRTG